METMRNHRTIQALSAAAAITLGFTPVASATDLTGHWRLGSNPAPPATFFDLQQTGNVVTFPAGVLSPPDDTSFDLTLNADRGSLLLPTRNGFAIRVLADGSIIDGSGLYWPLYGDGFRFYATRCECSDDNEVDGDGCDAQCRVEPCFSCTGDPSICTPLADGADCDDRRDCNSGETCNAGTCGGGSPVPSCIDMRGRWQIETVSDYPVYPIEDTRDVEQRNGFVTFRKPGDGSLAEVGMLDTTTGTLDLNTGRAAGGLPYGVFHFLYDFQQVNVQAASCGSVVVAGTVAASGNTFVGSGSGAFVEQAAFVHEPAPTCEYADVRTFSLTGRRCAIGECSFAADSCPICQSRNELGVCTTGPRQGCLHSLDPSGSSLRLKDGSGLPKDRFRWIWRDGEATSADSLGNLARKTGMQICLFDESGLTPSLVFQAYWEPATDFPDWVAARDPFSFRRGLTSGLGTERVRLKPGVNGETSVIVNARGGLSGLAIGLAAGTNRLGVPTAPLGLPLRIQAQMDLGGACFESTFDGKGVRRNKGGSFGATAVQ